MTLALLRQRFGEDPRIASVAARLADLPDDDRIRRIAAAGTLDELDRSLTRRSHPSRR